MLKLAICDDRQSDLAELQALLEEYRETRRELELAVFAYSSASALLDAGSDFDLFLLDILMPGLNGIELGQELRRKNPMAPILYLTTSRDFALESYRTEAMGYLLKPVDRDALFRNLDRATERCVMEKARALVVYVEDGMRRIFYYELVCAEAARRTLFFHLTNGTVLASAGRKLNFSKMWEILRGDGRFLLVRRGCLVNMDRVEWFRETGLELAGGQRISLPRCRRAELRKAYLEYCHRQFGQGGWESMTD